MEESEEEEMSNDGAHTETHLGISWRNVGKKRSRLEDVYQIFGDMGCESFSEVKEPSVKPVLGLCTQ